MDNFYITTTLPYVNAEPHIGFAMEIVRADILARYNRLIGKKVFFNTGTDEHGAKIYEKALEAGKSPQEYTDEYAEKFKDLKKILNLSYDNFVRTTDKEHIKSAQEFWKKCEENGNIYKKEYKTKYCIGCELEKTDSELVDGKCPDHPNKEIEKREEENYFFRFSKYQDKLLELYKNNPTFILPAGRMNEMKSFTERGLKDFSISRLKEKMPWGISVPNDKEHIMYVWFDALVSYISAIGWQDDMSRFKKWWPVVQIAGKDNLRQQSSMWQAMLMSVGIEPSKQILINGFITSGGQKMSKSLGNVVNPIELVDKYGIDTFRYYVARELTQFEDSDFTMEKYQEMYEANLVNGLGNLVNRIMKMAEDHIEPIKVDVVDFPNEYVDLLNNFQIQKTADFVWSKISELDVKIQETEPYKLIKTDEEKAKKIIKELVLSLFNVSLLVEPFMPNTAEKIKEAIKENKKPTEPLFPRLN